MKIFLQLLILLLFLFSCKSEKQKQFEKDIIGEWTFAKYVDVKKQENINEIIEEPSSPYFAKLGGFIFKDDKTLIDKIGFFDFYEGKSIEERKITYIGDSTVYKGKNKLFLEDSERFLLLNEILKAKQVQANFKEKYNITIFADDEKGYILKTDGKFFQFKNKIYDIGYNFIEINNLENRTEPY